MPARSDSQSSMKPKKSKTTGQRTVPRAKSTSQTPASEGFHEQIARRAYELYEKRVRQGPVDDWLRAEQEILKERKIRKTDKSHRGGYASEEQD